MYQHQEKLTIIMNLHVQNNFKKISEAYIIAHICIF